MGTKARTALATQLALLTALAVCPAFAADPSATPPAPAAPDAIPTPPTPDAPTAPDAPPTPAATPPAPAPPEASALAVVHTSPLNEAVAISRFVASPSEKVGTELLLPSGMVEAGAELVFVTADGLPPARSGATSTDETKLGFTDLAFFRLRARRSFGKSLELFAATELLAKQPSELNEPIWQSALVGLRAPFAKHFAFQLQGALGPTLGHSGLWWQGEPRVVLKSSVDYHLRFAVDLGNAFTALELSDSSPKPMWLDELAAGAEAQFGGGDGAFWVRTDYYVPLASSGQTQGPRAVYSGRFDPQVRINLQVGGVMSIASSGWDAYALYSWLDCGELGRPLTTLPILDGGFDQQQVTIGVVHRFGGERSNDEAY